MKRALRRPGVLTALAFAAPAVVPAADDALSAAPPPSTPAPK